MEWPVEHGSKQNKLHHQSHLPSPTILQLWFGEVSVCYLCAAPATLKHILVGCKASLTQGWNTWRHNQVLRCLAATLEDKKLSTNVTPLNIQPQIIIPFVLEGEKWQTKPSPSYAGLLGIARDWKMCVDLHQKLTFPSENCKQQPPSRSGSLVWLERESTSSGSELHWLCGLLHPKAAKGVGHQREAAVEINQRTLHSSGTKHSLVLDQWNDAVWAAKDNFSHQAPNAQVWSACGGPSQLRVSCDKWS